MVAQFCHLPPKIGSNDARSSRHPPHTAFSQKESRANESSATTYCISCLEHWNIRTFASLPQIVVIVNLHNLSINSTTMKFFFLLATVTSTATAFTTGFAPSVVTKSASSYSFSLNAEAAAATTNGTDKKKVIILGGDGFCGWPTSLYLSDQGHDVVIVDNLSRRNIDTELGCDSLTPIQSPAVSFE